MTLGDMKQGMGQRRMQKDKIANGNHELFSVKPVSFSISLS